MAHRLSLLQKMVYRRYLGDDQPRDPGTPTGPIEEKPSAQCGRFVDSQSLKSTGVGGEERGYDGAKKVKGRKSAISLGGYRRIRAQGEGSHSAKVMDWDGIKALLQRADMQFPRLKHLWVGWTLATGEKIGARSGWRRL